MESILQFPNVSIDTKRMLLVKTPPPVWKEGKLDRYAETFDLGQFETLDIGARTVLRTKTQSLTLFRTSNSVWWQKELDEQGEPGPGIKFAADAEALRAAYGFLREKKLANDHMKANSVTYSEVVEMQKGGKILTDHKAAQYANFVFTYEGFPVVGPGAKAQVTFGADLTPIEAYRFWRDVEPYKEQRVISLDEAIATLSDDVAFRDLKEGEARISFHKVHLAYYALPPRTKQQFLFPVYVFVGTASTQVEDDQEFVKRVIAVRTKSYQAKLIGAPQDLQTNPVF